MIIIIMILSYSNGGGGGGGGQTPYMYIYIHINMCIGLTRGVEQAMAVAIAEEAAKKGCNMVAFGTTSTERNEPVRVIIVNHN